MKGLGWIFLLQENNGLCLADTEILLAENSNSLCLSRHTEIPFVANNKSLCLADTEVLLAENNKSLCLPEMHNIGDGLKGKN